MSKHPIEGRPVTSAAEAAADQGQGDVGLVDPRSGGNVEGSVN
jgi:hypothetical protein